MLSFIILGLLSGVLFAGKVTNIITIYSDTNTVVTGVTANIQEVNDGQAYEGVDHYKANYSLSNWFDQAQLNLDGWYAGPWVDASGSSHLRIACKGPDPGHFFRIYLKSAGFINGNKILFPRSDSYELIDIPVYDLTNGTKLDMSNLSEIVIEFDGEAFGTGVFNVDYVSFIIYYESAVFSNQTASPSVITNDAAHNVTFSLKAVPLSGSITNVTINLGPVSGSFAKMTNISGDNYQHAFEIPEGVSPGQKKLIITAYLDTGDTEQTTISLTVAAIQEIQDIVAIYTDAESVPIALGTHPVEYTTISEINEGAYEGDKHYKIRYGWLQGWYANCRLVLDNWGSGSPINAKGSKYFQIAYKGPDLGHTVRIHLVSGVDGNVIYLPRSDNYVLTNIAVYDLTNGTGFDMSAIREIFIEFSGAEGARGDFFIDNILFRRTWTAPEVEVHIEGSIFKICNTLLDFPKGDTHSLVQFDIKPDKPVKVNISIYMPSGKKVKDLVLDTIYYTGVYDEPWDGTDNEGADVPSGVYMIVIKAGTYKTIKKMIVIR